MKSTQPTTSEEKSKPAEQGSPVVPTKQESIQPVEVNTLDDVKFKLNEKNDAQKLLQRVSQLMLFSVTYFILLIVHCSKNIHIEYTGNRR